MTTNIQDKISEKLKKIRIKDIMTRNVITTREDELLSDLADVLIKIKISGVPVVDAGKKVQGIVTTTDFLNLMGHIKNGHADFSGDLANANPKVASVMSKNPVTITEDHTLLDVVDIMCTKKIHTIPVVREEKLVGVVGRRDAIMYFYAAVRDSLEELKQK